MNDLFLIIGLIADTSTIVGVVIQIVSVFGERRRRRKTEKAGKNRP